MGKYNSKIKKENFVHTTVTKENGPGLTQCPEHELIAILSTGLSNIFYEREEEREKRFFGCY